MIIRTALNRLAYLRPLRVERFLVYLPGCFMIFKYVAIISR
jgi:hypothetical protein